MIIMMMFMIIVMMVMMMALVKVMTAKSKEALIECGIVKSCSRRLDLAI